MSKTTTQSTDYKFHAFLKVNNILDFCVVCDNYLYILIQNGIFLTITLRFKNVFP